MVWNKHHGLSTRNSEIIFYKWAARTLFVDTSVFVYIHGTHIIYILILVDNTIITDNCISLVTACIHVLASRFSLKNHLTSHTSSASKQHEHLMVFTLCNANTSSIYSLRRRCWMQNLLLLPCLSHQNLPQLWSTHRWSAWVPYEFGKPSVPLFYNTRHCLQCKQTISVYASPDWRALASSETYLALYGWERSPMGSCSVTTRFYSSCLFRCLLGKWHRLFCFH